MERGAPRQLVARVRALEQLHDLHERLAVGVAAQRRGGLP